MAEGEALAVATAPGQHAPRRRPGGADPDDGDPGDYSRTYMAARTPVTLRRRTPRPDAGI